MIKLVVGFAVIVLVGFVAAIQEAYECGFSKGYCEGMRNCEEIHRKEKEDGNSERNDTELH